MLREEEGEETLNKEIKSVSLCLRDVFTGRRVQGVLSFITLTKLLS